MEEKVKIFISSARNNYGFIQKEYVSQLWENLFDQVLYQDEIDWVLKRCKEENLPIN